MWVVVGYKNLYHVEAGKPGNHYDLENVWVLFLVKQGWQFYKNAQTMIQITRETENVLAAVIQ